MRLFESVGATARLPWVATLTALALAAGFVWSSPVSAADPARAPITPLQAKLSSIWQQDRKVMRVRWNKSVVGIWMDVAGTDKRGQAKQFAEAACKSAVANGLKSVGGKTKLLVVIFDRPIRNEAGGVTNAVLTMHDCYLDGAQE